MKTLNNHLSTTRKASGKQHRKYLVIRQNETSTIIKDTLNNDEHPYKKIYIPEGEQVILFICSIRLNGSLVFQYSILNDYTISETYSFDVIERKDNGYVLENNENIQLFAPLFYEDKITKNTIELTIESFDLEKNQVFFQSSPKTDSTSIIKPSDLFEINKPYPFKIKDFEKISEEFSIFHLEYKGFFTTVKAFSFQNKELIGTNLTCYTYKIVGDKLYLSQDKKALIRQYYNSGNNYKFTIKSLEKDEHSDYYLIEGKYGFTHRMYINYFLENSDNDIIGTEQEYFLRKIDDSGNLILKFTFDTQNKFYTIEEIFKSIGYIDNIEPYFYDLEEELKLEKYKKIDFKNLFDLYNSKENTWLFSYLNFLTQSYVKNLIIEKEYDIALDILKLTVKLEEWILEGSDYLSIFGLDKQERIKKMAESELQRTGFKIEALEKITSNTYINYIENISKKIKISQNLRPTSINVFRELLLFSDDLINKTTDEIVSIIGFLVRKGNLETYDYKSLNNLLSFKIKKVKKELNNRLKQSNYQMDEIDKSGIFQIIQFIFLQITLDIKTENTQGSILNSAALFRYYSYLDSNINNKKALILKAVECITKSNYLKLDTTEIENFKIENYINNQDIEIISPKKDSNNYKKWFISEGLICKSTNGLHLVNNKHFKANNNSNRLTNVASYLNNNINISSTIKLDLSLSNLDNIKEYAFNWTEYYSDVPFENSKTISNVNIGDFVKVEAKNYLKDRKSIIFLRIIENTSKGEGILAMNNLSKSSLNGLRGIINPGDIFIAEIKEINEKGLQFQLINQINDISKKLHLENDQVNVVITEIFNDSIFVLTEKGCSGHLFDKNSDYYQIGDVYSAKIQYYSEKFNTYNIELDTKKNINLNPSTLLRNLLESSIIELSSDLEDESNDNLDSNRKLIEDLIMSLESFAFLEEKIELKLELYYVIKLFCSIIKSSRSYYFDSLIKNIEAVDDFKNLDYKKSFINFDFITDLTLEKFQSLTHINESYRLLSYYNDVDSISKLISLTNESSNSINKKLNDLILAHNLLIKNGVTDPILLSSTKKIIYQTISNDNSEPIIDITNNNPISDEENIHSEEVSLGRETNTIEFKTSVFFYAETSKINKKEQGFIILKTICGFLNAEGGSLFLGVNDNGFPIGLDEEFKVINNGNHDSYERYIRKLIVEHFNKDVNGQIEFNFSKLNDIEYVEISIPEYNIPVSLREEFYQRQGNETRILKGNDLFLFFKRKEKILDSQVIEEPNISYGQQAIKFDFYNNQKSESNNTQIINAKNKTKEIAYLYFLSGGKYMLSKQNFESEIIEHRIPISEVDKKKFLIQAYDNTCINKIKVRTLLDHRFDYQYSNSKFLDAKLVLLTLAQDSDVLELNVIKDKKRYTKLYEIKNISIHEQMYLKGNKIIQETIDNLDSLRILDSKHKNELERLIYKSRQRIGKEDNNPNFKSEFNYLKNIK
jgi:hypothetical protein